MSLTGLTVHQIAHDYPITPKEHGPDFLLDHRHLWLRSSKQHALLRIRSEICQGIREFFHERDFILIDSPILTPAACEGTSTLFETDYFGERAYLSQSGQLYLEPETFTPNESVDQLGERFRRGAIELGAQAVRRVVERAGWNLSEVDFLATTTCTIGSTWRSHA